MIKVIEKAKIKLKDLTFELKDSDKTNQFVQSFEYVPLLYIYKLSNTVDDTMQLGNSIDAKDVIYVKLFNNNFLPEIELSCEDTVGNLISDLYPADHDVVLSIFVKSNSEELMPIRMDFRITEFETIKSNPKNFKLKYLIKGVLDVDFLHYTRYISKKGTSYDVIKGIALDMNLGFASNVDRSDDEMTWINHSDSYLNFISHITKRSFIDKNSFVWTFIDFQYNINYINIETELNDQTLKESQTLTNPALIKNDDERIVELYLTNNPAFDMTNKYIERFNLVNQSYKINLDKGYRMKYTWYEKDEMKIYRDYLDDLITQEDKLKQLYDYNNPIFNESVNDDYFMGKVDIDNVHKNYALAKASNDFNLENLEKMKMVVYLRQVNFSIKRFQNIRVEIYNINDLFSTDANTNKPNQNINKQLSGYWYVTGINYVFKRSKGVEQEITLMRRDLSVGYGIEGDDKRDMAKIS